MRPFLPPAALLTAALLLGCQDGTQPTGVDPEDASTLVLAGPVCVSPPSGLVSWWPLDETSGITAADIVDANPGSHVNGPTPVAGRVAGALSFDGVNDRVDIPDAPNLRPQRLTLDAWVKLDTPENEGCIICKQVGSNVNDSYALWVNSQRLFSIVGSDAGFSALQIGGTLLPLGTFFHAAMTWDGSVLRQYLDGTLVGSRTAAGATILYDGNPVFLGADDNGVNLFQVLLNGIIDEAEIFNRALSGQEIAGIFNAGSAGKCKNAPPEANAGGPYDGLEGSPVTLDGTGSSDPDGDALTFSWSASPPVTFDDPTSATPTATFPVGVTTATLTVTDPFAEFDTDDATVTVLSFQQATQNIIDALDALIITPGTPESDKLEDAIAILETAKREFDEPDDQAALGAIEEAVGELQAVVDAGLLDPEVGTLLMDQLAGIARQVAVNARDQALACDPASPDLADVQRALADGDDFILLGAFKDAVNKYKDALAKAEGVVASCP